MTRINCVPVQCLTDKHLLAEYREITRPFSKVKNRIEKGTLKDIVIPERYCLGTGHETFFFNKLFYLAGRCKDLASELQRRAYKIDINMLESVLIMMYRFNDNPDVWNDWVPTPEEMYLNMARLTKRSNLDNVLLELKLEER